MLSSLLLTLREGLEAALVVGVILGALAKLERNQHRPAIWAGLAAAGLVSLAVALGLHAFDAQLSGPAEAIFEGATLCLAAGVLTGMVFWMRSQGRQLQAGLEAEVRAALGRSGPFWGLFALAFVSVVREGVETALFLTAAAFTSTPGETLLGALLGLAASALLGWLLFAAAVRLNVRRFFQVTGVLLILFAAGLVAQGVFEFNQAGLIPPVIEHVWNLNPLLDETSALGQLLAALFGYNADPSLTEVLAYGLYYAALLAGVSAASARPRPGADAGR